ncbi:SRPBCC family protein [Gammaproteobacteria bacterium]|nr:SRPBCC family protein [Gammaproteobacteria bacterium]
MKKIEEIREFNYEIEEIWTIISDISRSDWVPGVSKITLENDTRIFEMEGMGDLVEKIISCDNSCYELTYSAIKTAVPIEHHLAKIKLSRSNNKTVFNWSTEIEPEIFGDAIRNGMQESLEGLQRVLES